MTSESKEDVQGVITTKEEGGEKIVTTKEEGADQPQEAVPPPESGQKRKRNHRHTPHQIQAMEDIFRDCPHPDTKQRVEISKDLGMDLMQVKFWFQNKRTQMKTKHERHNIANLKAENEKLHAENKLLRETLSNSSCPSCGRMTALGDMSLDECHLRMENARLKDEINRISGVAANYVGKPLTNNVAAPYSRVLNGLGYYDEDLGNILP